MLLMAAAFAAVGIAAAYLKYNKKRYSLMKTSFGSLLFLSCVEKRIKMCYDKILILTEKGWNLCRSGLSGTILRK